MGSIADNWKELSGSNNWKGLLEPLNVNLRRYVIHYGERVEAIYDSFNCETNSKAYGFPRFPPEKLFSAVDLQDGNPYKYTVTNYFYAYSEVDIDNVAVAHQSAWIGYVAVVTDEGKDVLGRRDILVSWRGTKGEVEWIKDFQFDLVSASDIFTGNNNALVHDGFHSIYTKSKSDSTYNKSSAREQVLKEVKALVDKYKDEEISITVTGHSLGAALATLNAADIVASESNKPTGSHTACTVTAFVFGSPHVGDDGFKTAFDALSNLHLLRIRNAKDIVPCLPPFALGDTSHNYVDVGEELKIDTTKSPYEKTDITDLLTLLSVWHNLENYLHGVAGTQGSGEFKLVVDRDYKLVNKGLDILKTEYHIPANWWTGVKNKCMVQLDNGFWKPQEYVPDPPST
ncbi:phospholipase A1-II 1-like [Pistacia vera]|uniref:phospholipase A1-II 1-like n=1 Tax=Pistacia vera TaxID=55513 RepID=UPI001262BA52|nr:phospholipase A1-II 1-like [Pistacia vera]